MFLGDQNVLLDAIYNYLLVEQLKKQNPEVKLTPGFCSDF